MKDRVLRSVFQKILKPLAVFMLLGIVPLTAQDFGPETVFALQQTFRNVSQEVLPVVVEINVVDVVEQDISMNSPFGFFFGRPEDQLEEAQPREFRQEGLGSGVIVEKRGSTVYVLTNHHVAGEAEEISVTLYDQRTFEAELVGTDPLKDLALLSFQSNEDIPVARLGNSDLVQVGDFVLAIGNPYGFESTVTSGIVSAKGRTQSPDQQSLTDYIQTDAAINRGNSGGALVNMSGEIIGINSWIASQTGGSIGLGFSIPVNNAIPAIADFINKGQVEYGWLGVNMGDLTESLQEEMGFDQSEGAFVYNVYVNSPAMNGGISPGDLIIAVNDHPIRHSNDLTMAVANREPDEVIEIHYIRENREYQASVILGLRDIEPDVDPKGQAIQNLWPGFTVAPLTREFRERLELPRNSGNLMIGSVDPNSKAGALGLQSGDIIMTIDGRNVRNIADFYTRLRDQERVDITVLRRGYELEYRLSL